MNTVIDNKEETMADYMQEVDKSMANIHKGEVKKATVIAIADDCIIANIGYRADAILPWSEYSIEDFDRSEVNVGDEFFVTITKKEDKDGNVVVSKRGAEKAKAYEQIEELYKNQEVVSVKIEKVTKGGLLASIKGERAFIPGSQITDTYVENLASYVGQSVDVQVIEFDPSKRKLILSGKSIAKQKRASKRQERINELVEGQKYSGTITKLMNYGAFVDLDGVEGLVHNTDLSWTRVKHPSDVVKEGDKVEVTVLSVNPENGKISLALNDVDQDPWQVVAVNIEEGSVVDGTVTKFMPFGAFVKIADGVEGLVHISQICKKRITKPEEVLELNQPIKAKVTKMDREAKKISLSITALDLEVDENMKKYMS
ncbi:MAG: 30S ribosomal protein S1 [Epulopiscium sp. Nele67-Bin002]|nr:MAG: 30S ribosomal protein S1 [Epulopiscium sp. Nele67-Bin002]